MEATVDLSHEVFKGDSGKEHGSTHITVTQQVSIVKVNESPSLSHIFVPFFLLEATMSLESAIPDWLVQDRTVPAVMRPGFEPAFELYTSRFPRETKDLVLAVVGAQYRPGVSHDGNAIKTISSFIAKGNIETRPGFHEVATVTDNAGYFNIAVLMYWKSKSDYHDWEASSGFGQWWRNLRSGDHDHGWFQEIFFPTIERLETVVTTEAPQGVANLRESGSGPIREHTYWGSMRDRFPVSQVDCLDGEPSQISSGAPQPNSTRPSGRLKVPGKKNLVVIRSGQDWSSTSPEERDLYLGSMHPTLTKGMDFLRDHGSEVGCFSCRFMSVVDPANDYRETDATFGLAYFDSLASLEKWSREHRTHLAIFAGFSKYAKKMGSAMTLKLFHEVLVLEPEQQLFEYIDCHRGSGLLTAISSD